MEEILAKLNEYVMLVSEAQEKDNYANNRPLFTKHLAAAAQIYANLLKTKEIKVIESLVKDEARSFGLAYIEGTYGKKIDTAWEGFIKATGIKI